MNFFLQPTVPATSWGVKAWERVSSARVAPLACNVQIRSCVFAVNLAHGDWKLWFRANSNLLNNFFPHPPLSQPYLTNFCRDEWRKINSNDQKRRKALANRRPNRSVESGRALKSLLCLPLWVRTERFPNISCPLKKKFLISFENKIFHFLWKQVLNCDCKPVGFNTWVIIGHLEPRETERNSQLIWIQALFFNITPFVSSLDHVSSSNQVSFCTCPINFLYKLGNITLARSLRAKCK